MQPGRTPTAQEQVTGLPHCYAPVSGPCHGSTVQATRSQSRCAAWRLFGWETPSRALVLSLHAGPAELAEPARGDGLIQARFVARVGCGMPRQHFRRIGSPPSQAVDQGLTLHL